MYLAGGDMATGSGRHRNITRRQCLSLAGAATAAPALPRALWAQSWPSRTIRVIIPFSAGSGIDIVGRMVLDAVSTQVRQPIVIENRTGAGGTIGAAAVAKSEPDGYTAMIHSAALPATRAMHPNAPFDVARDFAAVVSFGVVPLIVLVAPGSGIKTLQELTAAGRAKAGAITYASAGVGSGTHLAAERLRLAAGFQGIHVPLRGGPEALTEVMTGRVDFTCMPTAVVLPFVQDGKLKALAVSSPSRAPVLPEVPTTVEAGLPDSGYAQWFGLFLPGKTPRDIVERLHREAVTAMQAPGMPEKLAKQGMQPMPLSPAAFDAQIRAEIEMNLTLVKAAGLRPGQQGPAGAVGFDPARLPRLGRKRRRRWPGKGRSRPSSTGYARP
jgi:tripartite-type tricarboxylate transporter receptor subunit TctC